MLWSTTASVFSGARTLRPRQAQALERLRARHLMDEMPVDVEQAGAVRLLVDHMVVPDLVVEGAGLGHHEVPVTRTLSAPLFNAFKLRGKVGSAGKAQ